MPIAPSITIHWIEEQELPWVNQKYASIGLLPSVSHDRVALASVNGEAMGLGRLVPLDSKTVEMGGIYVFPNFRKRGVARAIVSFLLSEAVPVESIFCLPFASLQPFYETFGFRIANEFDAIPSEIKKKQDWCLKNYPEHVCILKKK